MSPSSSIHAAIEQLRAEIIAQAWQLSPQRLIRLKAALVSLNQVFAQRPHALVLVKMARSVVDHIEQQGNQARVVDFLKENLAHIVNIYEEDEHDPDQEKEKASRAYKHFLRLNISLIKEDQQELQRHPSLLLEKLESLAHEITQLPDLLEQSRPLAPEDSKRATALLGKISAAINIIWARLPPPPK
jgi:MinD-like ATPase involved in chromosome partitioning or flagellar assembly